MQRTSSNVVTYRLIPDKPIPAVFTPEDLNRLAIFVYSIWEGGRAPWLIRLGAGSNAGGCGVD